MSEQEVAYTSTGTSRCRTNNQMKRQKNVHTLAMLPKFRDGATYLKFQSLRIFFRNVDGQWSHTLQTFFVFSNIR